MPYTTPWCCRNCTLLFWFRDQILLGVLWNPSTWVGTGGGYRSGELWTPLCKGTNTLPSKARTLFRVRERAGGVHSIRWELALLVVMKWCLDLPENNMLGYVSVLSWRWKGVVECICLLLYNNLKLGYLTKIKKSNHNLKIYFFF